MERRGSRGDLSQGIAILNGLGIGQGDRVGRAATTGREKSRDERILCQTLTARDWVRVRIKVNVGRVRVRV